MKYLFLDNFRGFSDTVVPISDVNFLVGENSTGKTSLLALTRLLAMRQFWLEGAFHFGEARVGMFKDLVSIASKDRTYFSIGYADIVPGDKGNQDVSEFAFVATFVEQDGLPSIRDMTYLQNGARFRFHFDSQGVGVKSHGLTELIDEYANVKNQFETWRTEHKEAGDGYKSLSPPLPVKPPLWLLPSFIRGFLEGQKGSDVSVEVVVSRMARFPPVLPFGSEIIWLAPIRTRPLRTYDGYRLEFSPEGEHTPYLVKKLLSSRTEKDRRAAASFASFLEDFGQESGLFRTIRPCDYDRKTDTSPFELDIVLGAKALSIDSVGYGVSQALPVVVEAFARPKDSWFAIQQPEIHLHPKAQVALGALFYKLNKLENKRFFIETHSDFTIDGFRLCYKGEKNSTPTAQILFFERVKGGNILRTVEILPNGEISPDQPKKYREFFVKQQMSLLGI